MQIGINSLQALYQNSSEAIVNALVVNNINPLNVSRQLNNTQELIQSTQGLYLNTSEQAFVIIESNFSNSIFFLRNASKLIVFSHFMTVFRLKSERFIYFRKNGLYNP